MEQKTISNETLERVKTLPRIDFVAFQLLVTSKQVKSFIRFKSPRTIFYDEAKKEFLYLNPYHKQLHRCGVFIEESEVNNA